MKNVYLSLLLIGSMAMSSYAQLMRHDWSNHLQTFAVGSQSKQGIDPKRIVKDNQGDVVTGGIFNFTVDFSDNLGLAYESSGGGSDIFFKKSDSDGNFIWVKTLIGNGNDKLSDLILDPQDNIYVAGSFQDSIDIDPGPGVELLVYGDSHPSKERMTFVAKYSPDGELLWYQLFNEDIRVSSLVYNDLNASLLVAGSIAREFDFNPQGAGGLVDASGSAYEIFILDLSTTGDFNKVYDFGSPHSDHSNDIVIDGEGRPVICGFLGTTMNISGQEIGVEGKDTPFLFRIENDETITVLHEFDMPGAPDLNGIKLNLVNSGEDIWMAGNYISDISVDGSNWGQETETQYADWSSFVLKVDHQSDSLIFKVFGGLAYCEIFGLSSDGDNRLVACGAFLGNQDFDWSPEGEYHIAADVHELNFLLGFSTEGDFLFAEQLESSKSSVLTHVSYAGDDRFLLSGYYEGLIDMALNIDTSYTYSSSYISSGFELQLKPDIITALCEDTLYVEIDEDGQFSLSPEMVDDGSFSNFKHDLLFSLSEEYFDCESLGEEQFVTLVLTDTIFQMNDYCESYIVPIDDIAPTAICEDLSLVMNEEGLIEIAPDMVGGSSFDNCTVADLTLSDTLFDCAHLGDNSVDLTVTDIAGLTNSCTAIIHISDELPPELNCEPLTLYLDESGVPDAEALEQMNVAFDACGLEQLDLTLEDFYCGQLQLPFFSEMTAIDNYGNTSSCQVEVSVLDTLAPILNCKDLLFDLETTEDQILLSATELLEEYYDNCAIQQLTVSPSLLTYENLGSNLIEIEALDDYGNISHCRSNVKVLFPIVKEELVYIPNVFSPNEDGVNDQLLLFCSNKVEWVASFTILDRWGNIHHHKEDHSPSAIDLVWDGTMDAKPSPKGVYLYQLRVLAIDGAYYEFSGTVYLL